MLRNTSTNLYLFSQFKVFDNWTEERTSRFYVKLCLKDATKWTYNAITYQERMQEFFFPNLVDLSLKNVPCYLFVTLEQNPCMNERFKYPAVWKFEHFRKNNAINKFPESVQELEENHFPFARSFLEIYPGGAGMRVRLAQKI